MNPVRRGSPDRTVPGSRDTPGVDFHIVGNRRGSSPDSAPLPIVETVPRGLRIGAAYAWRLLLIAGLLALVIYLVVQLRYIVIPLMVALLLSALLVPFSNWLQSHRWPKWLAILVAMIGMIALVGGLVTLVVFEVRRGFGDLQAATQNAIDSFSTWLLTGPLSIDTTEFTTWIDQLWALIERDSSALWSGVLSVGSTAGHVVAGALLALFATLFFLIDGRRISQWVVRLFPRRARPAVAGAGEAGWVTLTTFVKVQIFVAFVDAVGIGLGAWILGLFFGGFPLVIPIAVAVFLGSFIPIVGALVSGTIAVFVALVFLGPLPAVIMLGIVLLVQQVEGHALQPLVMGTAVKVHPLAVVISVAAGSYVAGIAGALFAVPLVASVNVMITYIAAGTWRTNPKPTADELLGDTT